MIRYPRRGEWSGEGAVTAAERARNGTRSERDGLEWSTQRSPRTQHARAQTERVFMTSRNAGKSIILVDAGPDCG